MMMNKARTCVKPHLAFTLLELLLVLVLVGVSVATVIPNLNGTLGEWQLRETARNVQAALQLGSQWAGVRQEPVAFVLDVHKGVFSLRLFSDGQPATGVLLPMGRPSLGQGVNIARAEGLQDVGQEKVLVFRPDGTSEVATIVLTKGGAGATPNVSWQIDLDGRGTVRCQPKLAEEENE